MTYQALAFFTGLFSSLHCVAMCGPLMLAMPLGNYGLWKALLQKLLYQSGRIAMYAILGFIAGSFGKQFEILGWQKGLSIISGSSLILIALPYFIPSLRRKSQQYAFKFTTPITKLLSQYLSKPYGSVFAGLLNGLLPCGIVYMAIAGAINQNSGLSGANFMLFFGVGTTPLLLITTLAPAFFRNKIKLNNVTPYVFVVLGCWLIIRGSNLSLPFMPSHPSGEVVNCR